MAVKNWSVTLDGKNYEIRYEETALGRTTVSVNGQTVAEQRLQVSGPNAFFFNIGNHGCSVRVTPRMLILSDYDLFVDGRSVQTGNQDQGIRHATVRWMEWTVTMPSGPRRITGIHIGGYGRTIVLLDGLLLREEKLKSGQLELPFRVEGQELVLRLKAALPTLNLELLRDGQAVS